jgi:hypothetical protein
MIRVRFSAVCALLASGILLASVAEGAQRCEPSTSRACRAAVSQKTRQAASDENGAATQRRKWRHRHATRHTRSSRTAPAEENRAKDSPQPKSPETSPAARRFSEFVSPRLLAVNPIEDLHKPRINVTEFSGETAYPVAQGINQEPPRTAENGAPGGALPAGKPEQARVPPPNERQTSATPVAAEVNASALPVQASHSTDPAPSEGVTSWVRIVFLAWGGLLTLGSALRLLIG